MAPTEGAAVVTEPVKERKHAVAVGEKPTSQKVGKPKKAKAAKSTKPKSASAHPSYFEMISEAITSLKERMGSSQYAIAKFAEDKHKDKLPSNFKKMLLHQLKKLVASGKLVKIKNSFKLSGARPTPAKASAAKKPGAKMVKVKSTAAPAPKKVKPAAKPRPKTIAKSKTGLASKVAAKPKHVSKPKANAKSLKPKVNAKSKPSKIARTSAKLSPGKTIAAKKSKVSMRTKLQR